MDGQKAFPELGMRVVPGALSQGTVGALIIRIGFWGFLIVTIV